MHTAQDEDMALVYGHATVRQSITTITSSVVEGAREEEGAP